jgi:hypothetical protein
VLQNPKESSRDDSESANAGRHENEDLRGELLTLYGELPQHLEAAIEQAHQGDRVRAQLQAAITAGENAGVTRSAIASEMWFAAFAYFVGFDPRAGGTARGHILLAADALPLDKDARRELIAAAASTTRERLRKELSAAGKIPYPPQQLSLPVSDERRQAAAEALELAAMLAMREGVSLTDDERRSLLSILGRAKQREPSETVWDAERTCSVRNDW